jgi:hypothetical protein
MFRWKNLLGGLLFLLGALVIGILQIPSVSRLVSGGIVGILLIPTIAGIASGALSAFGVTYLILKSFLPGKTFLDVLKIMEKFGYKKIVDIVLGGWILSAMAFVYFLANLNSSFIVTFFPTFFLFTFMSIGMGLASIEIHHEEWLKEIRRQEEKEKTQN